MTRLLLTCCLILLWPKLVASAAAEEITYLDPVRLSNLENRKVNESSGLAVSRRFQDVFWTHNDSGDEPRLYCFGTQGNHLGTMELKKADAVDWEDMCSYERDGQPRLMVADVGDNAARRKSCQLYVLEEPKSPQGKVKPFQEIKLRYSTGAMDCEAIGVDVGSRKILLVEKRRWINCRVFEADLPAENEEKVKLLAEPIARIDLPLVTGMDVSPDGQRAVVLTLGQAFEFRRGPSESWKTAFQRNRELSTCQQDARARPFAMVSKAEIST